MDSHEVRREWAERSGEYSPDYYAHHGPDETSESVRSIVDRVLGGRPSIVELGCSAGRHLAHLREHGYDDLAGVEVNDDAYDVMAETYPELAEDATLHHDAIESVVGEFPDDSFDVVYSVETLQHLHPDAEWVYDELTRITGDLLITVENEGRHREENDDSEAERARPDATSEQTGGKADEGDATVPIDGDRGVNYVNDEFPLYYRDWSHIFTGRGMAEVAVTAEERTTVHDRDVVRAFRPRRD